MGDLQPLDSLANDLEMPLRADEIDETRAPAEVLANSSAASGDYFVVKGQRGTAGGTSDGGDGGVSEGK